MQLSKIRYAVRYAIKQHQKNKLSKLEFIPEGNCLQFIPSPRTGVTPSLELFSTNWGRYPFVLPSLCIIRELRNKTSFFFCTKKRKCQLAMSTTDGQLGGKLRKICFITLFLNSHYSTGNSGGLPDTPPAYVDEEKCPDGPSPQYQALTGVAPAAYSTPPYHQQPLQYMTVVR